ncbi:hypothetical protein ACGFJ7_26505 [Actinoplanes sp. NPDC048988]|uniref:hypothetical protein n=1 Tax=Actinoplanes sp. NPDC048988 TaxID=3363901 RepID=UPI0037155715
MNDTAFRTAPITLDRRLVLGDTEYQVTSFPAEHDRLDLCIVSSDTDGNVVSELSAGIASSDLPGLTDVLTSTLAGLLAMTRPSPSARDAPPPERRHPNQGTRWTPDDDDRLLTRYREGARPRDLMSEFGRSNGGIRARLEHLGELSPGARWHSPAPTPAAPATPATPAAPATPATRAAPATPAAPVTPATPAVQAAPVTPAAAAALVTPAAPATARSAPPAVPTATAVSDAPLGGPAEGETAM